MSKRISSARVAYVCLLFTLIVTVAVASFVRDRGQLLSNISLWLFIVPFVLGIVNTTAGLLSATALLTLSPSLHEQLNALGGMKLHAWSYPGVDSILGFLGAWFAKERIEGIRAVGSRIPSALLLLHGWIAISALIAVGRNLWQSASEFSLRGLVYNVWLVRGISWHDDYYPLQDAFFYSVALALFICVCAQVDRVGRGLVWRLVATVIFGASVNALFAMWQKATGNGWVNGDLVRNVNALWPDLHSFGAFMALALFLGFGALYAGTLKGNSKIALGAALVAAVIGLFLSGSRSTFLITGFLMIAGCLWGAAKLRGRRQVILAVAALVLLAGMGWALDRGYRGVSFDSLSAQLKIVDFNSLNEVLKQRPEMWWASLRMYAGFPLFGLGQGTFYRLSAIPAFSGSNELVNMGGGAVHNYFLQTFVELGPVALAIALLFLVQCFRLGRQNLRSISFYALVGIAVGNIYAHSLLVRETLMLCAIFAGGYLWEARSLPDAPRALLGAVATRYFAITLASLSILALIEVMLSFSRFPFMYGQRCFEVHPLEKDGWTHGVLRLPIPPRATSAEVMVLANRADLARRSLDLKLSVLNESASALSTSEYTLTDDKPEHKFSVRLPAILDGARFMELKPSHCYVPLNLGITYDPRRLGVRITELVFRTDDGSR